MLLSEFIKNLNDLLVLQGDGTIVVDVPERHSFTGVIDICDKSYQQNWGGLDIAEGKRPYCFLVVEKSEDNE